ncbi:amino acid transporter [Sporormia fimetaria CBS 119925]|uniref:Amino acid transporter n=1 Tax=Sporormia fimetaria CBS 119925 TaxID=1340428 RepID=A0A6A6UW61_9PLEO|nr:amino acid transporter [Sporormia fimetaria CBS 119925]
MADKTDVVTEVNEAPSDVLGSTNGPVTQDAQPFERYISLLGFFNFGFTFQAGWEATALSLSLCLFNGGPVAVVWGTIISMVGHTLVSSSLAEMASMDPTVGAQYRWSARFARRFPEFWGFVQGWITTFAWIVSPAAGLSMLAFNTQALIGLFNETYEAKAWHATMIMWAYLSIAIGFNLYLRTILNVLETIGGLCHVLFFVICTAVLATLAERSTASYVFSKLTWEVSGWNNRDISFQLGLLLPILNLSGYDAMLHMIDETRKPRERVPKAMIGAVLSNGVLTFAYTIVLMFFIGDEQFVTESASPVIAIFYQATKSKAATTIIVCMHMLVLLVGVFNCIASISRLVWAFARDHGLPADRVLTHVHPKLQIPLRALALVVCMTVILSLISIGSSVALGAIVGITVVALLTSYSVPIALLIIRKLKGEHPRYGPFKLGRWGLPINAGAFCFCIYCVFWAAFPSSYPVGPANMNYAGPILFGLLGLCMLDWFTTGHKRFAVPTGKYAIEMEDRPKQ